MQRRRRQYPQSHSPNRRVLAVVYACHSATPAYLVKYIIKSSVENDSLGEVLWRPRHRNLLENRRTPLIRAHMRQRPQNVLEGACEGASARFPANQYLESAPWLTNQVAVVTSIYSPVMCSWGHTHTHYPCRLPASRFTCWSGVFLTPLSLALLYTCVLVTVSTQSHSKQRLPFLSLGA